MSQQNNKKGIGFSKELPKEKKNGINYLFVIAIDKYPHVNPLENAVRDAMKVCEVLWNGYQFEKENSHFLYDDDATLANIIDKIDYFMKVVTPNDNFGSVINAHH